MNKQLKGSIYLIICSLVWGMAFAAQDTAMDYIQPFTFVFMRSAITFLVLLAITPVINRISDEDTSAEKAPLSTYLRVGGLLGCFLVSATILQQIGIVYTTPAKSGFVTALYIVIVPLLGLFMGRKIHLPVWIGVLLSLIGLCLLCVQTDLSLNIGDILTMGCALVFSLHILMVDRFAGKLNAFRLSTIQFGVCAIIAGIVMFIVEDPDPRAILACLPSIIYVAVFSGAIGYTLQMVGQKYTDPTLASLLMCLESVFAALGGWILLGQTLLPRELLGCATMLCASIVAQLPVKEKSLQK